MWWAIRHTFLTLVGKKGHLLDGKIGSYTSKWTLIKVIWYFRKRRC